MLENIGFDIQTTRAVSDRLDDFMDYIKVVCDENQNQLNTKAVEIKIQDVESESEEEAQVQDPY